MPETSKFQLFSKFKITFATILATLVLFMIATAIFIYMNINSRPDLNTANLDYDFSVRSGKIDAYIDILISNPKIMSYGKQPVSFDYKDHKLPIHIINAAYKKRFGVTKQSMAGCFVTDSLVKYADDYNKLIYQYIEFRFGDKTNIRAVEDAYLKVTTNPTN